MAKVGKSIELGVLAEGTGLEPAYYALTVRLITIMITLSDMAPGAGLEPAMGDKLRLINSQMPATNSATLEQGTTIGSSDEPWGRGEFWLRGQDSNLQHSG